jgi:hypothetical protein
VVDGTDGQRWAFTGDTKDGRAATFTLDKPPHGRPATPRQTRAKPSPAPAPAPAPIAGPIVLARLPEPAEEPPAHLPDGSRLAYGPDQWVIVRRAAKGGKRHIPHHRADGRAIAKAGPDPWPLWRQGEAIAHGRGKWLLEAEGEKCADWIRAAAAAATSQPGHAHTLEAIEERYRGLVAAGVAGVVYVEDNDPTGRAKGERCAAAAAAADLPFLLLPAADVWPDLPPGGSIDDAPGTAANRLEAIEAAIPAALELQTGAAIEAPLLAPSLPALVQQLPDGWRQADDGRKHRRMTHGQLADLLQPFEPALRYNELRLRPEIKTTNGWETVKESCLDSAVVLLSGKGWEVGIDTAERTFLHTARQNTIHPVKLYLEKVEADDSLEDFDLTSLANFLRPGDPDGSLYGRMIAKTLIGAVARVFNPGCKLDTCTVLVGEQGARKSTFWETLAGSDFYSCSSLSGHDKDALLLLHSTWFLELAELETVTSKRAAGELKNLLSTSSDMFRPPYGRATLERKRSGVMVGTSNRDDFLIDETGNRRFWIIPTTAAPIDTEALARIRNRAWRAAVKAWRRGETWHLSPADHVASEAQNADFASSHPWEGPLVAWLAVRGPEPFTSAEALVGAKLREAERINRADEMALSQIVRPMGWKQARVRSGGGRQVRLWRPSGCADLCRPVPTCADLREGRSEQADPLARNGFTAAVPTVPTFFLEKGEEKTEESTAGNAPNTAPTPGKKVGTVGTEGKNPVVATGLPAPTCANLPPFVPTCADLAPEAPPIGAKVRVDRGAAGWPICLVVSADRGTWSFKDQRTGQTYRASPAAGVWRPLA